MGRLVRAMKMKSMARHIGGECCELCGSKQTLQIHHIIPKSRTLNDFARIAADVEELNALLCAECHLYGGVHTHDMATKLLGMKMKQYGREAVVNAYENVQNLMLTKIDIMLPIESES